MFELLIRLAAVLGPSAQWLALAAFILICTFTAYVGITLMAALLTTDAGRRSSFHEILRDLLRLFAGRRK
jgi:hypothetical protein